MSRIQIHALQFLMRATSNGKKLLVNTFPRKWLLCIKSQLLLPTVRSISKKRKQPHSKNSFLDGINLIGYIKGEFGLGQSCRILAREFIESGIPFIIHDYQSHGDLRTNDSSWDFKITDTYPYNINLIHINPSKLPEACINLDRDLWNGRYNIGFWLWEQEEVPKEWRPYYQLLDEIWTPSEFISKAIQSATDLPVKTIPYAIEAAYDDQYDRAFFGLPEGLFLFLVVYDCYSVSERKNPIGAINAYKQAFGKESVGVGLVIKVNNATETELTLIREALQGYPNIFLITWNLEKVQINSLIHDVNVYVSLHRAEGFGLVLAEAMLLGVPTIATNWSANTEFMDSSVACMVDSQLIELDRDYGPFKKGTHWADPDIQQAAEFMGKLFNDPQFYSALSQKAQVHITEKLSVEKSANLISMRIEQIYQEWSSAD